MIDWKALFRLVDHKRANERRSFRELTRHLNLSTPSKFTRMKEGKATDAETFVVILNWLRISHRSVEKQP